MFFEEPRVSDFDNVRFVHHSFPEMAVDDVDISTSFAGFTVGQPFFINAMTGGSEKTKIINEKLAVVARETCLPIASGSLSVAIKNPSLVDSFEIIRKVNPKGLVFANLGAGHNVENAKKAIDILEADALQIHCNVVQEIIMPEGDRDFSNWLSNIEKIVKAVEVPVIVKEVGFGMSRKTIKELKDIGVKTIDISGSGGTNFAKIENYRRSKYKYDYLENFGQSTVISLLEAQEFIKNTDIIASGGIRHPLDIVKALALGAKAVGVAGVFLNMVLNDGVEKTIENINNWKIEIASIMTILGKSKVSELVNTDMVLFNEVREWCLVRRIDINKRHLVL
ncbi:MAG: type 2 isopentenyl-diphosphate Delta-isomerase [Tissierellia bacterium]|nr:type 2 isopentenyl-diphosphate Delta-isomerase [Tissierellia bacterium]